jgi:hypothetical protein
MNSTTTIQREAMFSRINWRFVGRGVLRSLLFLMLSAFIGVHPRLICP